MEQPEEPIIMDTEHSYLTECIAELEATAERDRSAKQKCALICSKNVINRLEHVKKPKPELSIVARPGIKTKSRRFIESIHHRMDTEDHF
jgi:hypothetical protein